MKGLEDTSMIEDDEQNVGTSQLKIRRRFNYRDDTSGTSQNSVLPDYVKYDIEFYHIVEFLSLQQGKVYNPSSSRMARWMAVSRNDSYERVERLVAPNKSEDGLYFDDVAAFWVSRLGLKCGLVLPVADLGEGPGPPSPPPLFWVKKEEMTEGKMAAMASKSRPPPPPLLAQGLDPPLIAADLYLSGTKGTSRKKKYQFASKFFRT